MRYQFEIKKYPFTIRLGTLLVYELNVLVPSRVKSITIHKNKIGTDLAGATPPLLLR